MESDRIPKMILEWNFGGRRRNDGRSKKNHDQQRPHRRICRG
jgi:hypothetical protein